MKKIILSFVLFCGTLYSQTVDLTPAAMSVANASVADNVYSVFHNPSSASNSEQTQFQFSYQNRFLLKELAYKSVGFIAPTKFIDVGLAISYSGFNLYNEFLGGVVLSRNFGNVFRLGVQFNYFSVYYAESNKRYAALFPQVGLQVEMSPQLTLGFSTFNPAQQIIKTEFSEKQLASLFSIGCNWHPSEDFKMLFQLDKNISSNYRISGGFNYKMKNFVSIQAGAYYLNYLVPSLGFGMNLNNFSINLISDVHPQLGLSTRVGVYYQLKKR